jgi:hypothetical protein
MGKFDGIAFGVSALAGGGFGLGILLLFAIIIVEEVAECATIF